MEIKVTFENGDILKTRINADLKGAKSYYIGKYFNLGSVKDYMQKAIKVEAIKI